jgi:hypothetical protein
LSKWESTGCLECLMTWLLKGDGGLCLLCQKPVYWKAKKGKGATT